MTSDYNTGSDLFPEKEQDGFTVVNARIGLRGPDQRWSIEFWGQNIFNTDYTQVAFSTPLQRSSPGPAKTGPYALGAPTAHTLNSAYLSSESTEGYSTQEQSVG